MTHQPHKEQGGRALRASEAWSADQEALFFDAIAEGSSIAAATRLVGKPHGSGASKFRRFALSLGAQGR